MLKAIIFDMDGVLVDSMRFQADAWAKVFMEFGININRRDIYILEGSNNIGIVKAIFEKVGKKAEPWLFEYLENKKREILDFEQIVPFKGIQNCLKELKKNFKLATVSGSSRYMVEKVVNKFYPKCFEIIITGDDFERGKPNPEPYIKALEKLNMTTNECIVVENSPMGISAAKRAGLYCVAVATTLDSEELKHADLIFEDHTALIDYLKSLTQRDFGVSAKFM
jgi:beta-phosphoglucomutase